MDPRIQQVLTVLQQSQRLNLKDPAQLEKARKVLQMANKLKATPNLPPEVNAELIRFYDSVGARPEVAGIKTQVQGNKWEEKFPTPPLFKVKK